MTEIAKDGDLGDLGKDMVGDAGKGVPPDLYNAFHAAYDDFKIAVTNLNLARDRAENAVALLKGWVTVGQKVLEVAGPLLARLGREHPKHTGGETPATLPSWYAQATQVGQTLEQIRSGFAASLAPLFPSS